MKPLDKYTIFLIEQAQAGRKNSYLELIGFYKKQVYLRSLQLLGKAEDAEKVSREVFFRAWKSIKLVNEYIPFELWLRGLTINIAMSYFRNKSKANVSDKKENKKLSVESEFDRSFLSLPLRVRQILILHDLEGYSFADIAALMDEDDFSNYPKELAEARTEIADKNENNVLIQFTDDEWLKLLSDFDLWPIDKNSSANMTEKLKTVSYYRDRLGSLLSSNEPSEETFEKLINYFFVHGEKVVEKRKKEKEIWKASFAELKNESEKKLSKNEKSVSPKDKKVRKSLRVIHRKKTFFALSAAAVALIFLIMFFPSNNFPWKVTTSYGKYLIASIENRKEIFEGDDIKTSDGSGVTFRIESVGLISLKENTSVKAVKGGKDESVVQLSKGTLTILTQTDAHRLTIISDIFRLFDFGSESEISLDDKYIFVERGKVKLFYAGKEYPIIKNYKYLFGDVAPVNRDAHPDLTAAVAQMKAPVKFNERLNIVLSKANEYDALTIWTLLRDSDKGATGILFNKLNDFFPLSDDISKYDILNLNKEKLNAWFDDIEWQL